MTTIWYNLFLKKLGNIIILIRSDIFLKKPVVSSNMTINSKAVAYQ